MLCALFRHRVFVSVVVTASWWTVKYQQHEGRPSSELGDDQVTHSPSVLTNTRPRARRAATHNLTATNHWHTIWLWPQGTTLHRGIAAATTVLLPAVKEIIQTKCSLRWVRINAQCCRHRGDRARETNTDCPQKRNTRLGTVPAGAMCCASVLSRLWWLVTDAAWIRNASGRCRNKLWVTYEVAWGVSQLRRLTEGCVCLHWRHVW